MSGNIWEEWKNFLISEYDRRSQMIGSMGGRFSPKQKGFSVLFFLTDSPDRTSDAVLVDTLNAIKGDRASVSGNDRFGGVSMTGHQFGMIERLDRLYEYFNEVRRSLKPEDRLLLTCVQDLNLNSRSPAQKDQGNHEMKFQFGSLYGPYFGLFTTDLPFLQDQVKKTDWIFRLIHHQEEEGYSVLLT